MVVVNDKLPYSYHCMVLHRTKKIGSNYFTNVLLYFSCTWLCYLSTLMKTEMSDLHNILRYCILCPNADGIY